MAMITKEVGPAEFKLTGSTLRVKSTGETGRYWGCDSIPPTSVTLVVERGGEKNLVDFAIEDVEYVELVN